MKLIDHYKPITSNWFFWLLTMFPFVSGLLLGLIVWSRMTPSFSPSGYETFMKTGALPLMLIGFSASLAGIYSLVHKSKQLSQQLLDAKLNSLRLEASALIDSADCILVHLYRLSNHISLLSKWAVEGTRDAEQISRKMNAVLQDWSAIYSDKRFYPAFVRVQHLFEDVDAAMCVYERGLLDVVISGKGLFKQEARDAPDEKFRDLISEVRDFRERTDEEYMRKGGELVKGFGFKL